jgi:hypothetical protein
MLRKEAGMTRKGLALLGGLSLLALASPAVSTVTTFSDNCYYCKFVLPTGNAAHCREVPSDANGNTVCEEDDTLPWPVGPTCSLSGDACFNDVVNGGGSSSGGGGSDGSCTVTGGNSCPPWCGACNRTP